MFPNLCVALGWGDAWIDNADVLGLRAGVAGGGKHQAGETANTGTARADDSVLHSHDAVVLPENAVEETVGQRQAVHHVNIGRATELFGGLLRDTGGGAERENGYLRAVVFAERRDGFPLAVGVESASPFSSESTSRLSRGMATMCAP